MFATTVGHSFTRQVLRTAPPLGRGFAWNAKWKQKAPRKHKNKRKSADQLAMEKLKQDARRREQKALKRRASKHQNPVPGSPGEGSSSSSEGNFVPPALLLRTGSPHVYLSKFTAQTQDVDPLDLFPPHEVERRPALFRQNTFVYDGVELFRNDTDSPPSRRGDAPQVAFLGRSNVGKSSLVNALMRRELARCSKQPGRTQQVHRFALVSSSSSSGNANDGEPSCGGVFLDLPGYGFAVAPDDILEDWQTKTQRVLQREYREGHLRRVFVLIDARQGVTAIDQTVLQWLQGIGRIPYTLVWTKADAVAKPQLIRGLNLGFMWYQQQVFQSQEQEQEEDGSPCFMSPVIHTTSTRGTGEGLMELLSAIEAEFLVEDFE